MQAQAGRAAVLAGRCGGRVAVVGGRRRLAGRCEVFVHLRADGDNVDQNDGTPRYFVKYDAEDALR